MIEVRNVTKRYGDKLAVSDVSFTVEKGEILGFLGRNGAGKSTTMNIITGYISATSGSVQLDGYDILEHPREFKRRIGYLPEQPPVYLDMTVDEYLRFVASIKDVRRSQTASHLSDITGMMGLGDVRSRLIRNLSKGYRQRVGMAQALVGNPEVVILDEPTVGLDPSQIIDIRGLIRDLGKDHTIILSSHILHEVADVCGRLVIISQGTIVAADTLQNLTHAGSGKGRLKVRLLAPADGAQQALSSLSGVRRVDRLGSMESGSWDFLVETDGETDVRRALFEKMAALSYPILALRPMEVDLEEVFLQLTSDHGEAT